MILALTGPSGVGKTTLLHGLLQALPGARPLMSYTTRARRPTDEPGEYTYISFGEFERRAGDGVFLWEAKTTSNRYGTLKSDIDAALAGGRFIPVLVVDAAKKLFDYARARGQERAVLFIYLKIDSEHELRKRFAARGEEAAEVEARLAECRSWNEEAARSGVPFLYIDASRPRGEVLAQALTVLPQA